MDQSMVAGVVRHVLTTAGGVFVTKGYVGASDWETVAGGIAVLIGVIWSVWQKKKVAA